MTEAAAVPCPGCEVKLSIEERLRARKCRCPRCGCRFVPATGRILGPKREPAGPLPVEPIRVEDVGGLIAACDACRNYLEIRPGLEEAWLTCPRCLARVHNPGRPIPLEQLDPKACRGCGRANGPDAIRCIYCGRPFGPLPPTQPRACLECYQEIPRDLPTCPFCEMPLHRWRTRLVDHDVRSDTRTASFGLILLAAVGACGIAIFITLSIGAGRLDTNSKPFTVGLFVVAMGAGLALNAVATKPTRKGLGGIVLVVLAAFGVLSLIPLALVVFLLVMCAFSS